MQNFVLTNAKIATMANIHDEPYGLIENAALVVQAGKIHWVGPAQDLAENYRSYHTENIKNKLITPGLIDCHTHLVYGGDRAQEFAMRIQGESYKKIAQAGGGILASVRATRLMSEDALLKNALPRLDHLINEGLTTIEIKSGYGLTLQDEIKMLKVARKLESIRPIRVKTTFLGAHTVPAEFSGESDQYIDKVCIPTMQLANKEGLVDAVDAFCESIAFNPQQVKRLFDSAKSLNIPLKIHAEQLSDSKGALLAASYNALSADHLEFLQEDGITAMKSAGTVAVLLPGAFYTLGETQLPPVSKLRKAGVPIALATDCNPGSSPLTSLLLAMNMGCTLFRLSPPEALAGVTCQAAKALGLLAQIGTIEVGKSAELAVWDVEHPHELAYRIGYNPLIKRIFKEV